MDKLTKETHMKKTIPILLSMALALNSLLVIADPLHLSGTYQCAGYDQHDGHYVGQLQLSNDEKASDFAHNFGSYHFSLLEKDGKKITQYSGEVAAHGDMLAVYFQNNTSQSASDQSDRGVGIASISHDQDIKGHYLNVLHKFYYEPNYARTEKGPTGKTGGFGTETCIQQVK